jgi:predicted DNA-binding ribbon-helix-helix protein
MTINLAGKNGKILTDLIDVHAGIVSHWVDKNIVTCYFLGMLDVRTNVLFEREDYQELKRISKEQGVTVGELVRKAVRKEYRLENVDASRQQLLGDIKALRKKVGISQAPVDYKALINEGRKY